MSAKHDGDTRSRSRDAWIDKARAVPIERIAPPGLKRCGKELVGPCPRCGRTDQFDPDAYQRQQAHVARWLWEPRQPIIGSPAGRNLRDARGTSPPPPALGFFQPSKPEHHPAMIAAFALAGDSEPGVLAKPEGDA
jgi:hypothetical protein